MDFTEFLHESGLRVIPVSTEVRFVLLFFYQHYL
jgi:hypothetical protein